MEERNGSAAVAAAAAAEVTTDTSPPATPPRVLETASETRPLHADSPPAKRLKHDESSGAEIATTQLASNQTQRTDPLVSDSSQPETSVILNESSVIVRQQQQRQKILDTGKGDIEDYDLIDASIPRTPVALVDRQQSTAGSSSPSDLSSSSRGGRGRDSSMSPVTPYVPEVPPAPPSTPASDFQSIPSNRFDGISTPLPYSAFQNADQLLEQQQLAEGAVTPAPTKRDVPKNPQQQTLSDDFSEWAVSDRYQLLRMLGRGSYGEVAQALDLYQNKADAYVAIKRIQSPFDQEVDAVRLFREIHILRRLRGHECIIQLLDVVQPPSEDLDDFHDLYLVFECK
jgi:hypothetical protein